MKKEREERESGRERERGREQGREDKRVKKEERGRGSLGFLPYTSKSKVNRFLALAHATIPGG